MMKNLRMLCLGLAAATFTASFAQTNVTEKLLNADMEKGVRGWNIEFESNIWKKNTKSQSSYHGFNGAVLENWKSDASTGLTDNTISQHLTGLPNGTYVFGAYIAAAKKDSVQNREDIVGVNLFANEVAVPVATNWPEHTAQKWSHTAKFNVAATVTDGTLNVGIDVKETNANFVIWDNATLYFFGNTAPEAALEEMAKIDIAASVALADTCKAHKMQVDTLAALTEQIEAAKAVTGVEGAYEADENLWWAFRQARASINDYRNFNNTIKNAQKVADMEWSDFVAADVDALNALIEAATADYEAATADRAALNTKKAELNEAVAYVQLDDAYAKIDSYTEMLDEMEPGENVGEYSEDMIIRIEDLIEEVGLVLEQAGNGITAVTAKNRCDSLYALVEDVLANPINFDEFPIELTRDANTSLGGYTFIKGTVRDSADVNVYESRVYRFQYPLTKVRFIVKETGSNGKTGNYVFFTLSSFEMFDENGKEIALEEGDITSNACHNTLNPGSPDGQGIGALVDDNDGTFFHSTWGATVNEHHYIEVNLPAGEYSAFSFRMRARGSSQNHQFPAIVEIAHLSEAVSDLQSAIGSAKAVNAYQGTAPGFYNADLTAFYNALAAAEALENSDATDAEIYAAIGVLEEEQGKLEELGFVMPQPGKKYQIISAEPRFFEKQGVHKALTVHSDSTKVNWLWWETAAADSAQQYFSFEVIENEEGKHYYKMKHEATGLYVGTLFDTYGDEVSNSAGLNAEADTVELRSLGYGQFGIVHNGMFHTGDHNSGSVGTGTPVYGCSLHGKLGDKSGICKWTTAAYNGSAWFIREMSELPCAAKSISDLNFVSETINLYEGINTVTLTADKDCAFEDLTVYGLLGEAIPAAISKNGAVATVILDTTVVESFSFSFTNAEGVAQVTVDGGISKLSILQEAYDAAVAVAPVKGEEIGMVSDLAEYEAAIAAAEALLKNGGTDEVIQQAANDLDSAVVHLSYNLPKAGVNYLIVSALPKFQENHGVDMVVFAKNDLLCWSYVHISSLEYQWQFEDCGELKYGKPAFYIKNAGSGKYISQYPGSLSQQFELVESTSATQPYRIDVHADFVMTLSDCRYSDANLHMAGHSEGKGAYGTVVAWNSTTGTASAMRVVEAEKYIAEFVDNIENIDVTDEYVAPAVKGIYDLYGRRVITPAATGIYIIDGKKRVIKK